MATFVSHLEPNVTTFTIQSAETVAWPQQTFRPADYGCVVTVDPDLGVPINCTDAVNAAIAAAGKAGGGIVQFGLGNHYVNAPLQLPDNVQLVGAGMGKTILYFGGRNDEKCSAVLYRPSERSEAICNPAIGRVRDEFLQESDHDRQCYQRSCDRQYSDPR